MTRRRTLIGVPFYAAAAFVAFSATPPVAAGEVPGREPVVVYRPSVPGSATKLPLPADGPGTAPVLRLRPVEPDTVFERCKRLPRTLPDGAKPQVCRLVR